MTHSRDFGFGRSLASAHFAAAPPIVGFLAQEQSCVCARFKNEVSLIDTRTDFG